MTQQTQLVQRQGVEEKDYICHGLSKTEGISGM